MFIGNHSSCASPELGDICNRMDLSVMLGCTAVKSMTWRHRTFSFTVVLTAGIVICPLSSSSPLEWQSKWPWWISCQPATSLSSSTPTLPTTPCGALTSRCPSATPSPAPPPYPHPLKASRAAHCVSAASVILYIPQIKNKSIFFLFICFHFNTDKLQLLWTVLMSKKCVLLCLFVCSGCHLCSSCRRWSLVESSAHHLLQGDQWGGDQICGLRRLRQSKDRLTQTNKVRISFLKHELCCDNDSRVHVFFFLIVNGQTVYAVMHLYM